MLFKIKNTDVKISFSFFAVTLVSIASGTFAIYFYTVISSLLHECVHILFLVLFKVTITEFSLSLFGADIKRETSSVLSNYKEALVSFSAPVTNILIGVIILIFVNNESLLGFVNLFIGVFNILPFYSFDGGRGLYFLLLSKVSEKFSQVLLIIISTIITVVFSFISIFIFFNFSKNYLLLIMSVYMIFSVITGAKKSINL